jgi:hypothetical protein
VSKFVRVSEHSGRRRRSFLLALVIPVAAQAAHDVL